MGAASRRKWTKRRLRFRKAKTVRERLELAKKFGHDKRFWLG